MDKLIKVFEEKRYYYTIETNSRIEVPFEDCSCSIVTVNNHYKVYVFNKDNDIIKESKWYKRAKYTVNYIINNVN